MLAACSGNAEFIAQTDRRTVQEKVIDKELPQVELVPLLGTRRPESSKSVVRLALDQSCKLVDGVVDPVPHGDVLHGGALVACVVGFESGPEVIECHLVE